jgi:ubiquinone/menaquinone biosynthesis C-methylase UbiE
VSNAVSMNCDGLAPYYEMLERASFGNWLRRTRTAYLAEVCGARRALLCGGGDGRFLARLLEADQNVCVDYVDLSAEMVKIARRRVDAMGRESSERVRFLVGDVRDVVAAAGNYDLIVTHFFLDCFSERELREIVGRLGACAAPGARWLVSEFHEVKTRVGRVCSRALIFGMYAAFGALTGLRVAKLPDYEAALMRGGFRMWGGRKLLGGLLQASLWRHGGAECATAAKGR